MAFILDKSTSLRKSSIDTIHRSVCIQLVWLLLVDSAQMRRIYHGLLQLLKSFLIDWCAFLLEIRLEHGGKWCRHGLRAFGKLLISPTEPNKSVNFVDHSPNMPT